MNKEQKEVIGVQLENEKNIINELKKTYEQAEKDIDEKIQMLMTDELTQSKIYQIEYQKALKGQIDTILDKMNSDNYESIHEYIKNCYEDSYIGTMYDLQAQGIPLMIPIDQELVVKAIQLDSKVSGSLYEAMGVNVKDLKKSIRSEISRGISQGFAYQDMARNINNTMKIGLNKSIRIARTEGHRVNQESTFDGMTKAKEKGADVVKQWDSTLDGKTRPTHRQLDGQLRELNENFEVAGHKAKYPGGFGIASEDVNCRCCILQRARWALDQEELETLKERAAYFGLDKSDNFDDFKRKYLEINDNVGYNDNEKVKLDLQLFASKTDHANDRTKKRNIDDRAVDYAIKNTIHVSGIYYDDKGRPCQNYIGDKITVVLNPETNNVVTTYRTSPRDRKRYSKKKW